MKPYLVLLSALLVVTAAAAGLSFLKIEYVQQHQNDALRSIICRAEAFVEHDRKLTPQQKQQSLHFYDSSLADANLAPCPKP